MARVRAHRGRIWGGALAAVLAALAPATAGAAVPFADIASAGPLTHVSVGNELSCQVEHAGDEGLSLFPSAVAPGDCGTLLAVGPTLYGPDFAAHDGSAARALGTVVPFTPVSQTPVTGSGTVADPLVVTTVVEAGRTGVRITQVDSYVTGQEAYRTDVRVANTGADPVSAVLYRAGDCYLQPDDTGYGFVDPGAGAAGCSASPGNRPAARVEQWYPLTPGASFMEGRFAAVWAQIATRAPLPDTCECDAAVDNAAAIAWTVSLAAGAAADFAHFSVFSVSGAAGPPAAPTSAPPAPAGPRRTTPNPNTTVTAAQAFVLPPAGRCTDRRRLLVRFVRPAGVVLLNARVSANGRRVPLVVAGRRHRSLTPALLDHRRVTARVDLAGVPPGSFTLTVLAVTATRRTITARRRYRTCPARTDPAPVRRPAPATGPSATLSS